ncbi:protein of unknown function, partial [Pseudobutyrivibrio ruminis]
MEGAWQINEDEVAENMIESVVSGINNHDANSIKCVFSESALDNAEDIDASIDELYDFLGEPIVSYEEGNGSGSTMESSDASYR